MPAIGDDHVAAAAEQEVRELARPRAKRTRRAQLEGVVGRGEQVGRPADAHRREPGERLVARRLDADAALDVGAESRPASSIGRPCRRSARRRSCRAAASAFDRGRRPAAAAARRAARTQVGHRVGRAGPAQRPRPRPHRACACGSSSSGRGVEQRRGIERVVLDRAAPRRPPPARAALRALVAAGVRVRDDDHRQARGRVASASVDEPARPTRRSAAASAGSISSPQERRTAGSARAAASGSASRAGQRRGVAVVAGDVDHDDRARRARGRASATASLSRRTACEPPKTSSDALVRGDVERIARRPRGRSPATSRIGVPGHEAAAGRAPRSAAQVASNDDRDRAWPAARSARTLRPGMTLPSHSTIGMRSGAAARRTGIAT